MAVSTITMDIDQKNRSISVLREIIALTTGSGDSTLNAVMKTGTINLTVTDGVITQAIAEQTASYYG